MTRLDNVRVGEMILLEPCQYLRALPIHRLLTFLEWILESLGLFNLSKNANLTSILYRRLNSFFFCFSKNGASLQTDMNPHIIF